MPRPVLDETHIHPAVRAKVAAWQHAIVDEVRAAVRANDVVVVGMGVNPFPGKARKALDAAGLPYKYLGYGSYLGMWRPRSALKMWTGWPTFPMVFVKGVLVGGYSDLKALIDGGELRRMLAQTQSSWCRRGARVRHEEPEHLRGGVGPSRIRVGTLRAAA